MSTSFPSGPTRQVQPGDTPDLNDGLLSRGVAATEDLARGNACVVNVGFVEIATTTLIASGHTPFVPIEDADNGSGVDGDINVSGVTPNQRVALLMQAGSSAIQPGQFVKPSDSEDGAVVLWGGGSENFNLKYARYLGKEAALLDTKATTPFDETLTVGIVPDQTLNPSGPVGSDENVGWFQLIENQGGVVP